ncbi:MAG TPA: PEP-CTERM sorting domain-containing protein [Sedimentisphaerales bacterium]|nr:PEP-CTERM sorting domain-containing protein [Sedimentisphaerales bacterium]HRS10284.1 PEP-CTERM sorting domain-containing protein [Sedimentisphaerales bacterium]HRV46990.1 PEP-CTERM sorting domain-containing protein [Sedimentisphaerales bacterium]
MVKRAILAVVIASVLAAPTFADMKVQIYDGFGTTNGGEFRAKVLEDPIGIYNKGDFISTFCLETKEYLSIGGIYYVTLSDNAIQGGVGPAGDPLDDQSKKIYNYWLDTLTHNASNADDVQNALWYQEGEGGSSNYLNSITASAANVKVMNLWTGAPYQGYAQDLLVRVPLPGAVLLGVLGMGVAGLRLRRRTER